MAYRSIIAIKADEARQKFGADGHSIVWAVLNSGIDGSHPHFTKHGNLTLMPPLAHRDFSDDPLSAGPLQDGFGLGTAIASIIAGERTEQDGPLIQETLTD